MWPFRKKPKEKKNIAKRVIVGMVIGGAITTIVGKKLMEKHEAEEGAQEDEEKSE